MAIKAYGGPISLSPVNMVIASLLIFWAVTFTFDKMYVNIRKLLRADYFALNALVPVTIVFALEAASTRMDRYFDGASNSSILKNEVTTESSVMRRKGVIVCEKGLETS
jgi:hypothetical protein